jgi:hypothetical protein
MAIVIEKNKLIRMIGKLKDALAFLDNGLYLYEENYGGENEDIMNELETAESILISIIDELREIVKKGEDK